MMGEAEMRKNSSWKRMKAQKTPREEYLLYHSQAHAKQ
jgi:hypothetical protein